MGDFENTTATAIGRRPWNKGKLTGAKPPLRPKHVWSIRTKLQIEGRLRDLAMFNLPGGASRRPVGEATLSHKGRGEESAATRARSPRARSRAAPRPAGWRFARRVHVRESAWA